MYVKPKEVKPPSLSLTLPKVSDNLDAVKQGQLYLSRRDLSWPVAFQNGWYVSTEAGDGVPRLVMPAVSRNPLHKYWQARSLDDAEPRYQSARASRMDALITVYPRTFANRTFFVTEGPMDALALAMLRCRAASFMGVYWSDEQMEHLQERIKACIPFVQQVVFVADNDPIGISSLSDAMVKFDLPIPAALFAPSGAKDVAALSPERRMLELEWLIKN